jgi:hypothetical protein
MTRQQVMDWLDKKYPRKAKGKHGDDENLSDPL